MGATPIPEVLVHLLGRWRVSVGGREIHTDAWHAEKPKLLLAQLALADGHAQHMEQLGAILWDDGGGEDPAALRERMGNVVRALRAILEPERAANVPSRYITFNKDLVQFHAPDGVWVDARVFEKLVTQARHTHDIQAMQQALALYTGDLLPEYLYADWAITPRRALHYLHASAQWTLAQMQRDQHDYSAALETMHALVYASDAPDDNTTLAVEALMRLGYQLGRTYEAVLAYQHYRDGLNAYGLRPAQAIQTLYAQIMAGHVPDLSMLAPATSAAFVPVPPVMPTPGPFPAGALPVFDTAFVGAAATLPAAQAALATTRLLTITGAGGSGKTRLAVELARTRLADDAAAVCFVDFTDLRSEVQIEQALAAALDVAVAPEQAPRDAVLGYVADRHTLIVMDNCEHLLDESRALIAALLVAAQGIHVLATSRIDLGLAEETAWRIPALTTPDSDHLPPLHELIAYPAVALFVETAQRHRAGFALTATNAIDIVRICQRLDGMPLALRLVAAHVGMLPLPDVLARLERSFTELPLAATTGPKRQRTLRAAIDWSYALLSDAEQRLFADLAVFSGGWQPTAAEAIIPADAATPELAVLPMLARLERTSLVQAEADGRQRLLEVYRQYAAERLASRQDEAVALHQRHAEWFVALAERGEAGLQSEAQGEWIGQLDAERANLRAALRWAIAQRRTGLAHRLVGALWRYWYMRGAVAEGVQWQAEVLALPADASLAGQTARAKALHGAGVLLYVGGKITASIERYSEALALRQQLDDAVGIAATSNNLAMVLTYLGDFNAADALLQDALARNQAQNDRKGMLFTLNNLGTLAKQRGDLARAGQYYDDGFHLSQDLKDDYQSAVFLGNVGTVLIEQGEFERSLAISLQTLVRFEQLGYQDKLIEAHLNVGEVALALGQITRARQEMETVLALIAQATDGWNAALATVHLAQCAWYEGNVEDALVFARESLTQAESLEYHVVTEHGLVIVGQAFAHSGALRYGAERLREALAKAQQLERSDEIVRIFFALADVALLSHEALAAVRLCGAATALIAARSLHPWPVDLPLYQRTIDAARATLGEAASAAAWATSLEEALVIAQSVAKNVPTALTIPLDAAGQPALTQEELEIARMFAEGLTYGEIAAALGVNPRSFERKPPKIFAKLNASSRAEVAAWYRAHHGSGDGTAS